MIRTIMILLFLGLTTSSIAQNIDHVYGWATEIVEALSEETEDADFSYLIDDLVEMYQNPININMATRQELERIVFLNGLQVENLLYHRYRNGAFGSIYELQVVDGFDQRLLEWLEPLIFFGEMDEKPKVFKVRGDLFLRTRFTIETPIGYKSTDTSEPAFLGGKNLFYSRFEAKLTPTLEVGFVAEKDPGEPSFSKEIATMDFMAGYLSWKPSKFLKQVVVGQYRISGGQGLVLQSGMNSMKSSLATSIRNRNNDFRPSLSVNEYAGLSGLLLSFGNKFYSVTPFVSIQNRDGRISLDADSNAIITGFKTDGYHRTLSELESRKNTREEVYGVQFKYFHKQLMFEAGHLEYRLEYNLQPSLQLYNQYYHRGKTNGNSWLALKGAIGNAYLFSEVAINNSLKPAFWGGLLFSPSGGVTMVTSYRRIPVNFNAPLGAPFAESSRGAGESGFYWGAQIGFPAKLTLTSYVDYFRFNWLQYQIKSPANGFDVLANLIHKPSSKWENILRYRHRQKMVNLSTDGPEFPVGLRIQNQFRFQTRFAPDREWSFTTRFDFHQVDIEGKSIPSGFHLGQEVRYSHPAAKWNVVMRYGIVDVEDYETRIYVYEPDVLYSFTTPAYYGQGNRWLIMGKFSIIKNLDFWARYGWWHYTNRETIGSGNTLIESNVVREFRFQLRKKF